MKVKLEIQGGTDKLGPLKLSKDWDQGDIAFVTGTTADLPKEVDNFIRTNKLKKMEYILVARPTL